MIYMRYRPRVRGVGERDGGYSMVEKDEKILDAAEPIEEVVEETVEYLSAELVGILYKERRGVLCKFFHLLKN